MAEVKKVLKAITQRQYDQVKMRQIALVPAEYSLANSAKRTFGIFRDFWGEWRGSGFTRRK
jgi:hypothetical protein